MQTPKIARLVKKMPRASCAGHSFASSEVGVETGDNRNQVSKPCHFLFLSQVLAHLPCIPASVGNDHSHSAQGTRSIWMYKSSKARSLLSLQELPGLSWGSCCCSPALTQPQGSRLNHFPSAAFRYYTSSRK